MSNDVEKLIDIEAKIDGLITDIGGQSSALDSIDTKVTKIPSIDTELLDQGLSIDNIDTTLGSIQTEQEAQGIVFDAIAIEQTAQGSTLDNIETEQTNQGLILDNIETEQTDQGLTLDDIETEQTNIGLSLDAIELNQTDGTQKAKIYSSNGGDINPVSSTTGAIKTIEYEHHEIHQGDHFFINNFMALGVDQSLVYTFIASATAKWAHVQFKLQAIGTMESYIYENAVVNVAGSVVTPINNNRNSLNASTLVVRTGDTFTGNGNQISASKFGSGTNPSNRLAGNSSRSDEIILKQGAIYRIVFTSKIASNVIDYSFTWYEHTDA